MPSRAALTWAYRRAYLRSRKWRSRRDAFIRKMGPFCRVCGYRGRLDVHHVDHGVLDGLEPDWALRILCREHHQRVHVMWDSGKYKTRSDAYDALLTKCGRANGPSGWVRPSKAQKATDHRKKWEKRELLGQRLADRFWFGVMSVLGWK